jgi:hypothetical protein
MKPTFILPQTKTCVVVWYRDGKKNEQLMDTPRSSSSLIDLMLLNHHVGYSEIRAVKSVEPTELFGNPFRRR